MPRSELDPCGTNVWVVSNWKPGFATDFDPENGDPGGDGIIIFAGPARPPARPASRRAGSTLSARRARRTRRGEVRRAEARLIRAS
ncbi:MAG TPA: hypothetical protein VHG93_12195, partial [Longimicrobium sp.]|nr:hypothetical protein [Longimicrobium sp.]